MAPGVRVGLFGSVIAAVLAVASPAFAQTLSLKLERPETGWIRATVTSDATTVTVSELMPDGSQTPVASGAPSGGEFVVRHAARWACDRRSRRFSASATFADGTAQTATADITTPTCRNRVVLAAASRARGRSRRISVRISDRWKLGGIAPRACLGAPGRRPSCRTFAISVNRKQAARSFRVRTPGLWTVSLRTAWGQSATRRVYVRPARALRMLATGDSMIQILDVNMKRRLAKRGVRVRSDARISTGLSKPFMLNWPNHARRQARSRPDVSVVFIGANDGFPIAGSDCCGEAWVDAYAARVRSMMLSYARGGRGVVYWLTLPAPRPAQWRAIYPAVNRAIRKAAAGLDGRANVVDLARVFTPGGRFRTSMVWGGRRQTVRQPDGVHLSPAGAAIAAAIVEREMRRDGVIR